MPAYVGALRTVVLVGPVAQSQKGPETPPMPPGGKAFRHGGPGRAEWALSCPGRDRVGGGLGEPEALLCFPLVPPRSLLPSLPWWLSEPVPLPPRVSLPRRLMLSGSVYMSPKRVSPTARTAGTWHTRQPSCSLLS